MQGIEDLRFPFVSGLAEGAIGAIIGGLLTYAITRRETKRKLIEYSVSSISLLSFSPTIQEAFQVSVDKFIITSDSKDKGTSVQIDRAYAFEIVFRNIGNDDIQEAGIIVAFDVDTKIVQVENNPENRPDYQIEVNKIQSNKLFIKFPYINSSDKASVTIITVDNRVNPGRIGPEYHVDVRGLGLKVIEKKSDTTSHDYRRNEILLITFVLIASITLFLIIELIFPLNIVSSIPVSIAVISGVALLVILGYFMFRRT